MSIPLRLEPDPSEPGASWVLVDGTLDGAPVEFLVDTGADESELAVGVGGDALRVGRPTSGLFGQSPTEEVVVGRLEVGPLRWADLAMSRRTTEAKFPSLLGMDLLRPLCCTFRFRRTVLDLDVADVEVWQPLVASDLPLPTISIEVDGIATSAIWDTGASVTVVDSAFVAEHREFFAPRGSSVGTGASGTVSETPMHELRDCRIAGRSFGPHRAASADLSRIPGSPRPSMIVGYTTMARADWTFDFPNGRWAFDSP